MARDPETISYTMSRIKGRDTGIELKLRRALHEKGIHYRVCVKDVFGHPDIVIEDCRITIFCDSEFWHGYHFEENKAKLHSNLDYWIPKIERNIARDKEVNEALKAEGYLVLRYWGFEINKELDRVLEEILDVIKRRKKILEAKTEKLIPTTLAYIEKEGKYLLIYRNKKPNDINEGKYLGVGGHVEVGESFVHAMKREILEETGLRVKKYFYHGKVYFLNNKYPPEVMYLFSVLEAEGELIECNEGELSYIPIEDVPSLPLWEGDRVFLPLLKYHQRFDLILGYEGDNLIDVIGPIYPKKRKKHGRKKN